MDAIERVHVDNEPSRIWRQSVSPVGLSACTVAAANGRTVKAGEIADHADVVRPHVHNIMSELVREGAFVSERKRGYVLQPCRCGSLHRRPSALRRSPVSCATTAVWTARASTGRRKDYEALHTDLESAGVPRAPARPTRRALAAPRRRSR